MENENKKDIAEMLEKTNVVDIELESEMKNRLSLTLWR